MPDYGIVPTGFAVKPLPIVLGEIETATEDRFGNDVVQDSQSELGQLNGLFADVVSDLWEMFLDVYQSFDVDAAEGPRLDIVAKLQRMTRLTDEGDVAFRVRIQNEDKANIKLAARLAELQAIDGVTFAWIIENSGSTTNSYGMPPHSVAYAVTGGSDDDVARVIYENAIGGIGLFGNYSVPVVTDGFCQTVWFIRPVEIPIIVELDVRHIPDGCQCAPPTTGTITSFVINQFAGECGYKNGDSVTEDRVEAETAQIGNMKIVDVRIARQDDQQIVDPIMTTIFERPVIRSPFVSARYVE